MSSSGSIVGWPGTDQELQSAVDMDSPNDVETCLSMIQRVDHRLRQRLTVSRPNSASGSWVCKPSSCAIRSACPICETQSQQWSEVLCYLQVRTVHKGARIPDGSLSKSKDRPRQVSRWLAVPPSRGMWCSASATWPSRSTWTLVPRPDDGTLRERPCQMQE